MNDPCKGAGRSAAIYPVTQGTDFEQFIPVPVGAEELDFLAITTNDGSANPVEIHMEASWIDFGVTLGSAASTPNKVILLRDRDGVATTSSLYWRGLSGEGEPVPPSSQQGQSMRLYIFVAGSELGSGESASVFVGWK